MKIIEAMKKIKDLQRKADDLGSLVAHNCALTSLETPRYPDQRKKVSEWIQAYKDVIKEILRLRIAIQKTNLGTYVTIQLGEKMVTKNIAEWIHRRRDLAGKELIIWKSRLSDRGIKEEGGIKSPTGDTVEVKIVRFFDQEEKDKMVDLLSSEPTVIDSKLEVVNAITDLIE